MIYCRQYYDDGELAAEGWMRHVGIEKATTHIISGHGSITHAMA